LAGQYFNQKQQQIADEHYRQDLLSKYFDQMTDLITTKQLLNPDKGKESQIIARARTLSTLRELGEDGERKGLLIEFLSEANLISSKAFVNLENADLSRANLLDAKLSGAHLTRTHLGEADLRGADLRGADLRGADLNGADLNGADLGKSGPNGADLNGAKLSEAKLSEAKLSEAKLSEAKLDEADLSRADLSRADLNGAQLSRAQLSRAQLSRADLSRAQLSRADLTETCLKQAESLAPEQVKGALNWQEAYYSPDFRKELGLPPDNRKSPEGCS